MPLQAHVGIGLRASQDVLPCGTRNVIRDLSVNGSSRLCSCMLDSEMYSKI